MLKYSVQITTDMWNITIRIRPVSHRRFSPSPADSVLSRRTLVKPPKNLQAIASRKTSQPQLNIIDLSI